MDGTVAPVIAGLSAGIGLVLVFASLSIPTILPEKVWMGLTPTQCSEPWDVKEWRTASDGQPISRSEAMSAFLEDQGIGIIEVVTVEKSSFVENKLVFHDDAFTCTACQCKSISTMLILIPNSDVGKLEGLGFAVYNGDVGEYLPKALSLADQMNETRDFKERFASYRIHEQVSYLPPQMAELYRQNIDQSFPPSGKPAIMVTYWAKTDVENSASLRVFIDPDTGLIYGSYLYITTFG